VDIDPNHRKVMIEELKFDFLKTFNLWIDEHSRVSLEKIFVVFEYSSLLILIFY